MLQQEGITNANTADVLLNTVELSNLRAKPHWEEEIAASWHNLSYSVWVEKGAYFRKTRIKKQLLNNIHGFVQKGELLAIMGGSGAGKSTMLDILAGRKTGGPKEQEISGSILYGGQAKTRFFTRLSGYVTQEDVHLAHLTARENLMYSARLRFPESVDNASLEERVEKVLNILGLDNCADTNVGDNMEKGLSGGEKRRLSIAAELLSEPNLLFLDEPTSGLDSSASFHVMKMLRRVADETKKAVIFSIHQPSSDVFKLFDRLLLLGKGKSGTAELVYFGHSETAMDYFHSLGYQCPPNTNPSDFLMGMCGGLAGRISDSSPNDIESQRLLRQRHITEIPHADVNNTIKQYYESEVFKDTFETLEELNKKYHVPITKHELHELERTQKKQLGFDSVYPTGWKHQFLVLAERTWLNNSRTPGFLRTRIGKVLLLSFLIATTYPQLGKQQSNVQNRISLLFFALLTTFMSGMSLAPVFIEERDVQVKERSSKLYRVSAFYAANMSSIVPFDLINSVLFSVIVYFACGLTSGVDRFFYFLATYFLSTVVIGSYILAVSAFSPTVTIATTIAPLLFAAFTIYCGFMILAQQQVCTSSLFDMMRVSTNPNNNNNNNNNNNRGYSVVLDMGSLHLALQLCPQHSDVQ
eukprot:TRINITY_DN1413_c1_g1_i7.p1 TRINITY_DN1413_c1_g1~~TRINITY_DN1413_c1_g1_i7.p1  ORF type:complete len:641 (-),score=152.46 TRINITY_DN1413_c1_g1_i7:489-2411(-)